MGKVDGEAPCIYVSCFFLESDHRWFSRSHVKNFRIDTTYDGNFLRDGSEAGKFVKFCECSVNAGRVV